MYFCWSSAREGEAARGGGWRSLARALIAFHLATAHEQRTLAKMKKIITSTSFRDCPDLGRSETAAFLYNAILFLVFPARLISGRGSRGGAGAGGEGPK